MLVVCGSRFSVSSTNAPVDQPRGFRWTMSMMSRLIILIPFSEKHVKVAPDIRVEICESLMFSLALFVNIVGIIHGSSLKEWNHKSLNSRAAAAIAASMAIKFVMDIHPTSTLYCLSAFVKREEFAEDDVESLLEYVIKYETLILKRISLMSCFDNHYVRAKLFLKSCQEQGDISYKIYESACEVALFFAFNYMEDWDVYMSSTCGLYHKHKEPDTQN